MSSLKFGIPLMAAVIAVGSMGAAFAGEIENENSQEITAALSSKTSITQAITSAEQQTGGRAIKVGLEDHDGGYIYKVKVITKDDNTSEVSVDPVSGKMLSTETEGLISRVFDRDERADAAKLKDAQTTLAAAIATAEQQGGGRAIEAGYENENGRVQFQVAVAKDHTVQDVKIDTATGKVVKVEAAGDGEHQDGEQKED